jgi:hypothetical protein
MSDVNEPDVWLVELTNEQMAEFWAITNAYEEDALGAWSVDCDWDDDYPQERESLRSLQGAVEYAKPVWL